MSERLFEKADGILDMRLREHYVVGHLKDSTWLPFEHLDHSLNQLPAVPATLFLVGAKEEIEEASILLDQKGYKVNGSLILDSGNIGFWSHAMSASWEIGKHSKRLWQPADIVQEWVDLYRPESDARLRVLDLGCGGGRDAVYLAKQRMDVIAIDQEARVLKRAKALAQASGANVKFKCCDLTSPDCLPEGAFDLIVGVRFLKRDLLPNLINKLNPNAYIVWQTFLEGAEKFGSPKNPNALLKAGELAEVFAELEIIVDKIDKLHDGRPINSFIAKANCDRRED